MTVMKEYKKMLRICSWGLVALLSIGVAEARDYRLANLEIITPWARATPPSAPAGGGFVVIKNTGAMADRLVSARSPAAGAVQIHEMKMDGNVMRMRELEKGLEIPAGATVTLAPGGLHLMMMGLKEPLKQGSSVPLTLVFEKAGSIDVELTVEGLGAAKPSAHKH
jgi:copper(I)-binding protein